MAIPQAFSDWIEATSGARLLKRSPVGGGCIHSAWRLTLADGQELFAKTNRAELLPVLEAEAQGLEALARAIEQGQSSLRVPRPCGLGLAGGEAVLLLNWLELGTPTDPAQAWEALGAGLAQLHRGSLIGHDGRFGWERDNFIGSGPQANRWGETWGAFFAEQRLWPAIDVNMSGTRKEEKLIDQDSLEKIYLLRRVLNRVRPQDAMELLIARMEETPNNAAFLEQMGQANKRASDTFDHSV